MKDIAKSPMTKGTLGGSALGGAYGGLVGLATSPDRSPAYFQNKDTKKMLKRHKSELSGYKGDVQGYKDLQAKHKTESTAQKKKWKKELVKGLAIGGAIGGGALGFSIGKDKAKFRRAGAAGAGTRASSRQAKDILGLRGVTTKAEAKKTYRAMAKKHHPDVGGSSEKMKEINDAWEAFSNSAEFDKLAGILVGFCKRA